MTQPTRTQPETVCLALALGLLYFGFLATLWLAWPTTEHDPKPDTPTRYAHTQYIEVIGTRG